MFRRSVLCWLALLPLLCLNLFPFGVMLSIIFQPNPDNGAVSLRAVLSRGLAAVSAVLQANGFATAFVNSLEVALASSFWSVLVAVPAAYAMSRYRFRFRRLLGDLLLISQMLSPLVLVLGLSQTIVWLRLGNSLAALVLIYAAFQVAFAVWLLHGYFDAIPREIEEAARVDGASSLRTLWSIFIPLSLPAIVVTGLVGFIAAWNEFALALTILRSQRNYTLSVQIYALVAGRYEVQWRDVMVAVFAASVPVAVLFALLHRSLLRSLHSGLGR